MEAGVARTWMGLTIGEVDSGLDSIECANALLERKSSARNVDRATCRTRRGAGAMATGQAMGVH